MKLHHNALAAIHIAATQAEFLEAIENKVKEIMEAILVQLPLFLNKVSLGSQCRGMGEKLV